MIIYPKIEPNMQIGRWIVLEKDLEKTQEKKKPYWLCKCTCEKETIKSVSQYSLKAGKSNSCGCLQLEVASKQGKKNIKQNRYDLTGEYGIGWTSNTNKEFYFDLEDYDKIKNYTWRESDWGYCLAFVRGNKNQKTILMQYIIYPTTDILDHHNRNRLDNRKNNLRPCSQQENLFNKGLTSKNKSGFIGVHLNRKSWIAQISINKVTKHLGSFKNKEDAVKARLQAEKEYYGEFAPQQHLFKEYGIE